MLPVAAAVSERPAAAAPPVSEASVVGEFDDAELFAVGIEFVDEFGGDFHLAAIEVVETVVRPTPSLQPGCPQGATFLSPWWPCRLARL